jgi:DNA-binding NtrC family response regulator
VPALRERKEDIPLLFRKFAVDFCNRYQMPPLSLNEEATRLLQESYWRGNIRQLKNLAEQIAVIELDHQINADTLRKYLPKEESQQGIVLRNPIQEQSGKDYSHEIGILYNMLMKTQQELRELKEELTNSVFSIGENEKSAPTAIIQTPIVTPDTTARKQIEAEDIESSLRIEDAEIERIKRALEVSGGNRKVAAAKLDISERTLYRKIKEYGL